MSVPSRPSPLTRRTVLGAAAALPVGAGTLFLPGSAPAAPAAPARPLRSPRPTPALREVAALEREHSALIGFFAARVGGPACRALTHRADDRAPVHSVFKSLAAAAVLRDLDRSGEVLDRLVRYDRTDLVPYSPVTEPAVDRGLTVRELCDAAIRFSDNTAANLLLEELGGPPAITAFARSLGDRTTRLDRTEPTLNEAAVGDPRDTTSPRAIAGSVAALLVGRALTTPDRQVLRDWMLRNTTSDRRFRAGLPTGWQLADKTGSGTVTFNDVGVAWPPHGRPVVIAALVRLAEPDVAASEAIHAALAALAARELGRTSS